jgi:nitrite reductase/ring-hydroxylating ferredoxin subunit
MLALVILFLMAATSHDFWLKNLTPKTWKTLHMLVYLAYALVVMHVMTGVIQLESQPVYVLLVSAGALWLITIHLLAGFREARKDSRELSRVSADGFVEVGIVEGFEEGRAKIFQVNGERVAVFLHEGKLFGIHNECKHQGGPLGEGKIVDGCITCPWHGYQYFPKNGQSPPPFKEKVRTYALQIISGRLYIDPKPFEEGYEQTGAEIYKPKE